MKRSRLLSALALPLLLWSSLPALAGDPVAPAAAPPAAAPPAPAPVVYKLEPGKSHVYVQVFKDPTTMAAGLSHDHVIAAKGWTGSFTWDPANPAACKADINVPVAQLDNDSPEMRKKVGYDTTLDDDGRADVKEHMLGDDQLNASKYPNITFKVTKCEGTGTAIKVTGDFSLHGVTKTITVPMTVNATPTNVTAKGSFKVKHTDYGMEPFSALLGQLKNNNEMTFFIDVIGKP